MPRTCQALGFAALFVRLLGLTFGTLAGPRYMHMLRKRTSLQQRGRAWFGSNTESLDMPPVCAVDSRYWNALPALSACRTHMLIAQGPARPKCRRLMDSVAPSSLPSAPPQRTAVPNRSSASHTAWCALSAVLFHAHLHSSAGNHCRQLTASRAPSWLMSRPLQRAAALNWAFAPTPPGVPAGQGVGISIPVSFHTFWP